MEDYRERFPGYRDFEIDSAFTLVNARGIYITEKEEAIFVEMQKNVDEIDEQQQPQKIAGGFSMSFEDIPSGYFTEEHNKKEFFDYIRVLLKRHILAYVSDANLQNPDRKSIRVPTESQFHSYWLTCRELVSKELKKADPSIILLFRIDDFVLHCENERTAAEAMVFNTSKEGYLISDDPYFQMKALPIQEILNSEPIRLTPQDEEEYERMATNLVALKHEETYKEEYVQLLIRKYRIELIKAILTVVDDIEKNPQQYAEDWPGLFPNTQPPKEYHFQEFWTQLEIEQDIKNNEEPAEVCLEDILQLITDSMIETRAALNSLY